MMQVVRLSLFLSRNIRSALCASVRHYDPETGGEDLKNTTVTLINKEDDDYLYVEAYSQMGFKLSNGFRIFGPCVLFPRSILHWGVSGVHDINEKSLSLFPLLEPKLDLLLIGIGDYGAQYDKNIIRFLRDHRINVEILPTDQASATFNFLNAERRIVAAALIPPSFVQVEQDEDLLYRSQLGHKSDPLELNFKDPFVDKPGELDGLRRLAGSEDSKDKPSEEREARDSHQKDSKSKDKEER